MAETEVYERINQVDEKHTRKAEKLRDEMNVMAQTFQGHISDITTSMAVVSERFKQMKEQVIAIPKPEKRPCDELKGHLEEHEKYRFVLVKSVIGAIVTAIVTALGTLFIWRRNP